MEVPDKIYSIVYGDELSIIHDTKRHHKEDIEYIRKDALLEWLKPGMDITYPEDYERGCIDGRNDLREELIEKIESL